MGGDFAGVTAHIEAGTFTDLGVNALWLTPFNTAANGTGLAADGVHEVSAFHGYWPVEPRGVDPRLGTPEELEALVDAAHAAGIRVLGDFVVNHVHEDPLTTTNIPSGSTPVASAAKRIATGPSTGSSASSGTTCRT